MKYGSNRLVAKIIGILFFLLLFSGVVFAVEFSADTITTYEAGGKVTGKIYYKPDRFRVDMKISGDTEMTAITRIDKKVIWNVMPQAKLYMEMPFNLKNMPMVENKFEGEIERKEVGSDTIDGHPAKKYLITYKLGNEKHQVYQWLATDINFPVKTTAVDGSWSQEFRNVKMGSQPDSLFEVPSGYQKMQMPQIPGGMNFLQGK